MKISLKHNKVTLFKTILFDSRLLGQHARARTCFPNKSRDYKVLAQLMSSHFYTASESPFYQFKTKVILTFII